MELSEGPPLSVGAHLSFNLHASVNRRPLFICRLCKMFPCLDLLHGHHLVHLGCAELQAESLNFALMLQNGMCGWSGMLACCPCHMWPA